MIHILLFAHLQEIVGQDKITIEQAPLSIKELKQLVSTEYKLDNLENVMVAVNEEYAELDDIVKSGDTVALIPPVSGG